MTFEDFLEKLSYEYTHPGEGDADRNGNTRLAILQVKYHLSSLKIQKLLITAGVFVPVKVDSHYYEVKKLRAAGMSTKDIAAELSLSVAAVNAFLPYEKGAMNLDNLGVEISDDAARKRKQRRTEEMKKEQKIEALNQNISDEAFWNALGELDKETFISTTGKRYGINAIHLVGGMSDGTVEEGNCLLIYPEDLTFREADLKEETGSYHQIPQADVFAVLHNALELMSVSSSAGGSTKLSPSLFEQTDALPYVYPLLVACRVIEGDGKQYMAKRKAVLPDICTCCGRRSERLFDVSSYADLWEVTTQLEEQRRGAWSEAERSHAEMAETMAFGRPYNPRKQPKISNSAINAFDAAEEHMRLCSLCAQAIKRALEDGEEPEQSKHTDYEVLPEDKLKEEFEKTLTPFAGQRFIDLRWQEVRDDGTNLIYIAKDAEGNKHIFDMQFSKQGHGNNDIGLSYFANEIFRLTKTGKIAESNARTNYKANHYRIVSRDDEIQKWIYIGFLELEDKINVALLNPTMRKDSMGSYSLRSSGTIIPCYFGDKGAFNFRRGREWDGGEHGFLIDGRIFSGNELAEMFSSEEGALILFQSYDPADRVLHRGEYLMPVSMSVKGFEAEAGELVGMFTDGVYFLTDHDERNFHKMFEKLLDKLRLYHNSNPRGYGRLAGMGIIKRLEPIVGTEVDIVRVKEIIGE